jgi:hypothetical protein
MDYLGSAVASNSSGNRLTFTFSLANGEQFQEGEIRMTIPAGWSAPSNNSADPGYTTTDCTFLPSISGQVITIEGQNLTGPASCSITYGALPGPGVTVPSTSPGPVEFATETRSTLAGTFTQIAAPPVVDVVSADGTGALDNISYPVANGSSENGLGFEFSLQPGEELQGGAIQLTVPSGWDPPSDNPADGGYTTSTCGAVQPAVGQTITITGVTLSGSAFCEVFYGDLPGPGVTAPTTSGPYTFATETKSTPGGTFAPIGTSPVAYVTAPDGSGTMMTPTQGVPYGSTGNMLTFTYTAAFGGIFDGAVTLEVPPGWSAPDDSDPMAEGFTSTTAGCGCLFVVGRTIIVDFLVLGLFGEPDTFDIVYGDTSGGGPGGTAPTTSGKQAWPTKEASNCSCDSQLRRVRPVPNIRVLSQDGSGSIKASPTAVSAGSYNTMTFKYAADPGGMSDGSVSIDVPNDWTQPTTTMGQAGYVTASAGTVSTVGQTITVSNLTLFGNAVTITYGSKAGGGPGAQAPSSPGPATWSTRQSSSPPGGPLTPLLSSPQIGVYAADGSGTLTFPPTLITAGSTGNTIQFTYTAAAGGLSNGAIVLMVPAGWSAPSTNGGDPGYTVVNTGNIAVAGRKVTVSNLNLPSGGTLMITYGSGTGATAPSTPGSYTWVGKERSTKNGVLTTSPPLQPAVLVSP